MFDSLISAGRDTASGAEGDAKDTADKYVSDLEAAKTAAGA